MDKNKKSINTRAVNVTPIAAWSYTNLQDAMMDRITSDFNFNQDMFKEATRRGEADAYLSLIQGNKDLTLSQSFYDASEYDYESRILELYRNVADDTKVEERFGTVWNEEKQQWVEDSIGEMTEKEYLTYQLGKQQEFDEYEKEQAIAQLRKDNMTGWQKFATGTVATLGEFAEGLAVGFAGINDFIGGIGYAATEQNKYDTFLDAYVDFYANKGLVSLEREYFRAALDEYERNNTMFKNLDGEMTTLGKYLGGIANSWGRQIPGRAINMLLPGSGTLFFYMSMYSSTLNEVGLNPDTAGSPAWLKVANAGISAFAEAMVEVALDKMLGSTIQNRALGLTGKGIVKELGKNATRQAGYKYILKSALQEGLEEFLQDITTEIVDQASALIWEGYGNTEFTWQTLFDSAAIGFLSSLAMSGGKILWNGTVQRGKAPIVPIDGKATKLKGAQRLVWTDIISDFSNTVNDIERGKVTDIDTYQEVQAALSSLVDIYGEIGSKERIKNAVNLLDRVIAQKQAFAKQSEKVHKTATSFEGLTIQYGKTISETFAYMNDRAVFNYWQGKLTEEKKSWFNKKVKETDTKRILAGSEKTDEGVVKHSPKDAAELMESMRASGKSATIEDIENIISSDVVSEYHEDYKHVWATDGKIAFAKDDTIFIPVQWIKNYKKSEVYKFLAQENVLEKFKSEKIIQPFLKEMRDRYAAITNHKNVSYDEAILSFLFNPTFFEDFMLRQGGKNLHKFKDIMIRTQQIFDLLVDATDTTQEQRNYYNQLREQSREKMRLPVLKAILNWNMDIDAIGAKHILTKADQDYILEQQVKKRQRKLAVETGKINAEYATDIKDLMFHRASFLSKEDAQLLTRFRTEDKTLTIEERQAAYVMVTMLEDTLLAGFVEKQSLIVPIGTDSFVTGFESPADIQHVNNVLSEFSQRYGVNPVFWFNREHDVSTIKKLSREALVKLYNDMQVGGYTNVTDFVVNRLRNMLGDEYSVIYKVKRNMPVVQPTTKMVEIRETIEKATGTKHSDKLEFTDFGLSIVKKVAALDILNKGTGYKEAIQLFNRLLSGEEVHLSELSSKKYAFMEGIILKYNKDVLGNTYDFDTGIIEMGLNRFDPKDADYELFSLIHELNHIVQTYYNLQPGSNPYKTITSPGLVNYILKTYPQLVKFYERNFAVETALPEKVTYADILVSDKHKIAAVIAYYLITGELWATQHLGDKGLLPGIRQEYSHQDQMYYFVTHDGQKFPAIDPRVEIIEPVTAQMTENITLTQIENEVDYTIEAMSGRIPTRDTFHSQLTNKTTDTILGPLLRQGLSVTEAAIVSINDIVTNPYMYLRQTEIDNIKAERGIVTEGTVFHYLKARFEGDGEGISIDMDTNGKYILVNDNAFSDLYHEYNIGHQYVMAYYLNDKNKDSTELVTELRKRENLTLRNIYNIAKIREVYKIPNVPIVLSPTTETETVIHNKGVTIYIKSTDDSGKTLTNRQFMHKLNHEFRHVVQFYHGMQVGMTTNFQVTPKMRREIKTRNKELFENQELRDKVARLLNTSSQTKIDDFIVRRFVYYRTGSEMFAYGYDSRFINEKPLMIDRTANKTTVYMDFYNAKTGEGKYELTPITRQSEEKEVKYPAIKKKPLKYKEKVTDLDTGKVKYKYDTNRYFTNKEAEGTNLENFIRPGKDNQMDPDLQNFVKATTGNEYRLPPELVHTIKTGDPDFNKETFMAWFRSVDAKQINKFTFDLINRHFFQNEDIKSMQHLQQLVDTDIEFWWAVSSVLAKEGMDHETMMMQNTPEKFEQLKQRLQADTKLMEKVEKQKQNFNKYSFGEKEATQETINYMRVLAMEYFHGSLASIFYVARVLRNIVRKYQHTSLSIDYTTEDGRKMGEFLSDEKIDKKGRLPKSQKSDITELHVENIILAKYEAHRSTQERKSPSQMRAELLADTVERYRDRGKLSDKQILEQLSKEKLTTNEEKLRRFKEIREANPYTSEELYKIAMTVDAEINKLSDDQVQQKYDEYLIKSFTGMEKIPGAKLDYDASSMRVNIVSGIKSLAKTLNKYIDNGRVKFNTLPPEVQELFTKKGTKYYLKEEAYSVGRGAIEGKGNVARDTARIMEVRELLKEINVRARAGEFASKEMAEYASTIIKARNQRRALASKETALEKEIAQLRLENQELHYEARFKQKGEKVPTEITIVSNKPMPYAFAKMFEASNNEIADTKVQFASRNTDGTLYNGKESSESRLKHEVNSWNIFYELNQEALTNLTRSDILDTVEFIEGGAVAIAGSGNKVNAFQIFTLGYIIDAIRYNNANWNFSDAEIAKINEVYEQKASEFGSGLNAVSQMQNVINPFRTVQQMFLSDFGISEAELDPLLHTAHKLQQQTTEADRKNVATELSHEVKRLEALMRERTDKKTSWYEKIKSFRYSAMLSSPVTWVRNLVSNVAVTGLNKASDFIGNLFFNKKAYHEGQWDLRKANVTPEIKQFVNTIVNHELFKSFYERASKYDPRARKSEDVVKQQDLFVRMLTQTIKRKYYADTRFTNEHMQKWSRIIDAAISDRRFVKYAAENYFAKILALEIDTHGVSLNEGMSNRVLNLFADALITANEDYMHKRSFMANMLDKLRYSNPVAHEILHWWQPFLNSSFNWFSEMMKYTPMGLVNAVWKLHKIETQIEKLDTKRAHGETTISGKMAEHLIRRDIGKGTIGLLLMATGILLGSFGKIRIDEDDYDRYIMEIGKIKVDISNIFGTSSLLAGVGLSQAWKTDKDFDKVMGYVANSFTNHFLLTEILERHTWNESSWEKLLTESESFLKSFTPQLLQWLVRASNNYKIKYSPGMIGMFERVINSFVVTQPLGDRRVNPYTGEVETKYAVPIVGDLLASGVIGPRILWSTVSDEELLAHTYGVKKKALTGEITTDGRKSKLSHITELNKKYGELNRKTLQNIESEKHYIQLENGKYKTLHWKDLTDEQRNNVIDRELIKNAQYAKIYIWTQLMGNQYSTTKEERKRLRALGITTNIVLGGKGFVE